MLVTHATAVAVIQGNLIKGENLRVRTRPITFASRYLGF